MALRVPEFRDTVTIKRDNSPAGAEEPDYQTVQVDQPCQIVNTRGQQVWRGRQLEETADFVVVAWDSPAIKAVGANDQIDPTGGRFTGVLLNVTGVQVNQELHGRSAIVDIFCEERRG
jgi:hypothetical protein